ncbi:MAG: hypothetical protein V1778_03295 [bacterium]
MRILILIFVVVAALIAVPPARATTEVVEETPDSTVAPAAIQDLCAQGEWQNGVLVRADPSDTFGTVSNSDPLDVTYGYDQQAKKWLWTIIFWVDPLNGSWIGKEGDPVGMPPYKVFVGGPPEGSCKFDKRWGMPAATPLLHDENGVASPDNVGWALRLNTYGKTRFVLFIEAAKGRNAPGNIVMCSPAYHGGQKCCYLMDLHKDGTVTIPD